VVVFFSVVLAAPFLAAISELLVVVTIVSFLSAQEAKNATPIKTVIEERMDFFIGCS
jgi:hypothetical protein